MQNLSLGANAAVVALMIFFIAAGAHWMVDAASRLAKRMGWSELVIGLTIIAFGTSAPEFAVSSLAAYRGQGDISVGNIVGSNIFNLGFILGGCALVRAIPIPATLIKRDGLFLCAAAVVLFLLIGFDFKLDRTDGMLLLFSLALYLVFLFKARKQKHALSPSDETPSIDPAQSLLKESLKFLAGLTCIVGGSHLLVQSATQIAVTLGLSQWLIGVTIVAAGTSMPELATSLAATLKGRYGISAGSLIGSDIFNLLGVLGLSGTLNPVTIDSHAQISLLALCAMVFTVVIFMRRGFVISRQEGAFLIMFALARWAFDLSYSL